ncbi:hypothetical protein [Nosocomiicoccus ampullae]|uniref:hypothetical protein n=1 Tax=Nosocomiicoccus ampullae TaxID=489910 RepID=UPI00254BE672|nr:hypothetical protein [Nosocomiicoccus ampullae]MDK6863075.1 hypothetical protein [Nosocomiicoccus ampullae]
MLTNLQLKKVYSTLDSNVAKDFYIPCLENSIIYKRVAGYFSAAALAYFSSGLEKLFENNGEYKLIISQEISLEDYELIKMGYELKEKQENLIEKIKNEYDLLENNQKKILKILHFL